VRSPSRLAGCIFAEFIQKEALLPGRAELDQLTRMFKLLGTPNERIWPGLSKLENASKINMAHHQYNSLRNQFPVSILSEHGFDLLNRCVCVYVCVCMVVCVRSCFCV
jgi:cell division cycle 2-like